MAFEQLVEEDLENRVLDFDATAAVSALALAAQRRQANDVQRRRCAVIQMPDVYPGRGGDEDDRAQHTQPFSFKERIAIERIA